MALGYDFHLWPKKEFNTEFLSQFWMTYVPTRGIFDMGAFFASRDWESLQISSAVASGNNRQLQRDET